MEWLMWKWFLFSSVLHLIWFHGWILSSAKKTHTHKLPWTWNSFHACSWINYCFIEFVDHDKKPSSTQKPHHWYHFFPHPKIIQIPWSWAWAHHTWVDCGRRVWTNNKKSTSQKSGSCSDTQIYIIKIHSKCQGGSWMLEMMVLWASSLKSYRNY